MLRRTLLPLLGALLLNPALASAQEECDLEQSRRVVGQNMGTPYEMAYIGSPVLSCPNGIRITADSAIFCAAISQVQFLGRVRFTDPQRQLDSDYAQYVMENRHLAAQGNVLLIDRESGATIRAPTLDYLMESPARPEARIEVYRGRPRTTLLPTGESGDTTVVDSDALSIIAQRTFIGRGDVVLTRGTLTGSAGELEYDQERGTMRLDGAARLATPEYTLDGETIVATLEGDTLRELSADGEGMLRADDLDVEAAHIRVFFDEGEVGRLVAFRSAAPADAPTGVIRADAQARVRSPEFIMTADSIDVLSPQQRIERLHATGNAFAERVPTDSAEIAAAAALPELVRRDWVRGDTVVATFIAAPVATDPAVAVALPAPDAPTSAAPGRTEQVLETLIVTGADTPASSAYRIRDENEPSDSPLTVNYVVATQIVVTFADGAVRRVEAEGDVRGVHIRPTVQTAADAPPRPGRP
jgi:lipopolysaccharide export system protein LptA